MGLKRLMAPHGSPKSPTLHPSPAWVVWAPCKARADLVPPLRDQQLIFMQTL